MDAKNSRVHPRDQELMLFQPHMRNFDCKIEAEYVPSFDEEANQWFREARKLEDPEIYIGDRDYPRIIQLTRQAAERNHWKAMLNLASLYVEGREPGRGGEDAIKMVEKAMQLGIPAAYDRMGTYYMNGTGVSANATKAYAFWQHAAVMGNPQAMAFLGSKLVAVSDDIIPGYWSNPSVALKMLECAVSQGYGPAAYDLYDLYLQPRSSQGQVVDAITDETKARAIKVLHDGVKYGCSDCAIKLYLEFDPSKPSKMIAPFIDKARSERYRILARALEFNPDLRFPNLDQALPLPPATIPAWNGEQQTLLDAVIGVSLVPRQNEEINFLSTTGRQSVNSPYRLRCSDERTSEPCAPFAGYWQPTAPGHPEQIQRQLSAIGPGLYAIDEAFDVPHYIDKRTLVSGLPIIWKHWLTVNHDYPKVRVDATSGLIRTVQHSEALIQCQGNKMCQVTGVWQPWIDAKHPIHLAVNQYWRQSWVREGQFFPNPQRDWLLDLPANLITWHLLDSQGVEMDCEI
ncbi:sel1 repeat family protein [Massilia dura]|uniref:Sel1 repeat family protein n=1 Tax=Pseudoduganella dura TaxID=321982 RepID=A0A6I3XAU6_9BURK|nr:DUF6396 domain-containing protein [Pseudoduganella dura]MUI12856.1 sel1 repeat family protein [Pseudoduganella dura]GGX92738.1 hypothetical protein GCM10007386_24560 [Pseudoduganella dura]